MDENKFLDKKLKELDAAVEELVPNNPFGKKIYPRITCVVCGTELNYKYSEVRNRENATVRLYCSKTCKKKRNRPVN